MWKISLIGFISTANWIHTDISFSGATEIMLLCCFLEKNIKCLCPQNELSWWPISVILADVWITVGYMFWCTVGYMFWCTFTRHTAPEETLGLEKTFIKTVCAATWKMSVRSFWCIEQKDLLGNFWDIEFFQFWFITPCWRHSESYTNGFYFYFFVMQNVVEQQLVMLKWYLRTFISSDTRPIVLYWLANRCDKHVTVFVWQNEFKIHQYAW